MFAVVRYRKNPRIGRGLMLTAEIFLALFDIGAKTGSRFQEFGSEGVGVVPDLASRRACSYFTPNLSQ